MKNLPAYINEWSAHGAANDRNSRNNARRYENAVARHAIIRGFQLYTAGILELHLACAHVRQDMRGTPTSQTTRSDIAFAPLRAATRG